MKAAIIEAAQIVAGCLLLMSGPILDGLGWLGN